MLQLAAPLAPVHARAWPEAPLGRATVVCEGPSAYEASPEELAAAALDGPMVAVNRAIAFQAPFDVWATIDDPANLWGWAQDYLHSETKLLSSEDKAITWRQILPDLDRLYVWHPTYMDGDSGLEDQHGLYPLVPTLFTALAWLLHVGVREVRLLGVDMAGTGSQFLADWQEETDELHACRWSVERKMLADATRIYRARGARITRWEKSRARSRNR